jgi:hypothetical protein
MDDSDVTAARMARHGVLLLPSLLVSESCDAVDQLPCGTGGTAWSRFHRDIEANTPVLDLCFARF